MDNWLLGFKLKQMREKSGLKLKDVSEKVGISSAFLSLVENGRSGISIGKLQSILDVYGKKLSDLYEDASESNKVLPLEQCQQLGYDIEGISSYILLTDPGKAPIFPVHFRLEPGASIGPITHKGDEICFIIEGEFEFIFENLETGVIETYVAKKWDTVRYAGDLLHTVTNVSSNPSVLYSVIYYTDVADSPHLVPHEHHAHV
jgi:transcriptional regulator with XRE-family HTH domain